MGTLNDMTGNKNVMEDKIVVYVMKDDPAETIDDAKDYTFAYTDSYGYEETKETIDDINKKNRQYNQYKAICVCNRDGGCPLFG